MFGTMLMICFLQMNIFLQIIKIKLFLSWVCHYGNTLSKKIEITKCIFSSINDTNFILLDSYSEKNILCENAIFCTFNSIVISKFSSIK